jgi:CrcB protein
VIGIALAFVVAAAAGALARAAIGHLLNRRFPWGTLSINVSGSFMLGLLAHASSFLATVVGTGLLGAYTTFSSFARDIGGLWERDARTAAAVYAVATLIVGVAAAWVALAIVA